jgi:hypothetical protein
LVVSLNPECLSGLYVGSAAYYTRQLCSDNTMCAFMHIHRRRSKPTHFHAEHESSRSLKGWRKGRSLAPEPKSAEGRADARQRQFTQQHAAPAMATLAPKGLTASGSQSDPSVAATQNVRIARIVARKVRTKRLSATASRRSRIGLIAGASPCEVLKCHATHSCVAA